MINTIFEKKYLQNTSSLILPHVVRCWFAVSCEADAGLGDAVCCQLPSSQSWWT